MLFYSLPAPLTRDSRPVLIGHSQDFLPCILDPSHVRVRCVLFLFEIVSLAL